MNRLILHLKFLHFFNLCGDQFSFIFNSYLPQLWLVFPLVFPLRCSAVDGDDGDPHHRLRRRRRRLDCHVHSSYQ